MVRYPSLGDPILKSAFSKTCRRRSGFGPFWGRKTKVWTLSGPSTQEVSRGKPLGR